MALLATLALAVGVPVASAQTEDTSWWSLNATAAPTLLPRQGEGQLLIAAAEIGSGAVNASGEQVMLTDRLPAGVTPVAAEAKGYLEAKQNDLSCAIEGRQVACKLHGTLAPYRFPLVRITVRVEAPSATSLLNSVQIEGGQTPVGAKISPAKLEQPLTLQKAENEPTPFGVQAFQLTPEGEDGSADVASGSHPFQLTTLLDFNQTLVDYPPGEGGGVWPSAPALPQSLRFKLPPGLVGDPSAVPSCSDEDFAALTPNNEDLCPQDTAVGVALVTFYDPKAKLLSRLTVPVFNLEPARGEPARFGFEFERVPIVLQTKVPSGGDYGVEVSLNGISQAVQVLSSEVTLWAVPGDPSHNASRGWGCLAEGEASEQVVLSCEPNDETSPKPFLTLPTSCETLTGSVTGDSWPTGEPGNEGSVLAPEHTTTSLPALEGCGMLDFNPLLSVEPETQSASTPTGLNVGVEMKQEGLRDPEEDAEAAVKSTTVKLPPGLLLSPAAANALQDCTAAEFDFLDQFGDPFAGAEESLQTGNETTPSGPANCPEASKVGTVDIQTPLLPHELTGSVYLAAQNTNPFRSPLAIYLLAEDPAEGIRVKLAGSVEPDAAIGQVTSTFENTPQLPFSALHLHFFGGERASLSTPPQCGPATATSEFVPWSAPEGAPAHPEATFQINAGAGGGACPPSPLSFAPSFKAGPDSPQAAAFSPIVVDIGRPDGQQALSGLSVTLPPGFAAVLAGVTPCPEPAPGQEWSCGEASQIGEAREYSGLSGEPFQLTGQAYLTSGYHGAPFGLLVRTLAQAGPFNLGWVNVRSRINVNPHTAAVTVTTDPGPRGEGVPTMLDGVPVQLKALEVAVNRSDFTFNPTGCDADEITGLLDGAEGARDPVSATFKAENCAALAFKPTFAAAVKGQASKANGASLTVKVASPGLGVANIAKAVVTLPKALPSRLTTIQKACLAAVFEANPAACDEGSLVGSATIHTPIFKNPLSGPAYLVSHGDAAFPDLEFVLQGEGVEIVLDGKTDIKKGVTTATFENVPDAPFTSFETVFPAGPHSALTANVAEKKHYDLCGDKLVMPTTINGQNGSLFEQQTKIGIQGCSALKGTNTQKLTRAQELARALAACRAKHKHAKAARASCERAARRKYGAKKTSRAGRAHRAAAGRGKEKG
ncbi:MAG TPA: hypothetical protein VMB51_01880 [Solirubrobacteraceae bacterium]|nr:hypothetical protein [Solirubrobacteraceae bacterium]